jgi:Fe-S-cluster-containing dehydrogenase component
MACQIANEVPGVRRWRRVRTFNELHVHGVEVVHLSLACNHCAAAPCMEGCPARSFYRDDSTGAVLIDEDKCIGCRYCSWVCPYDAPQFDEERGIMTKCDFCVERQHSGDEPACVKACPTGALSWDELGEDELFGARPEAVPHARVPGMRESDADPSIRIVPLEASRMAPRQTEAPAIPPWKALSERVVPHITVGGEWILVIFTTLVSVLVGMYLASAAGAPAPDPSLFLIAGAGGLLLGASHLGRRARAWRAAMHAEGSWLSREIVLFCVFLILGSAAQFLDGGSKPAGWLEVTFGASESAGAPIGWLATAAGWLAAAAGIGALFSVDRIYHTASIRGGGAFHSANALGTGILLAAAWSGSLTVLVTLSALKALLYTLRKWNRHKLGLPVRAWESALRLGLLATGTLGVWRAMTHEASGGAAAAHSPLVPAFCLLAAAELIDRAEYYDELEIPTPESLMLDELSSRPEAHGTGPQARSC